MNVTAKSISTDEPIAARRISALKNVNIQQDVMRQFAEAYRFTIGDMKEVCIDSALKYLNNTFFRSHIEDGRKVTSFHQMQVITVALETGLNPFNNELYGVFTPFGDLKIMATVDGWNRLATSLDIQDRSFSYSETTEQVEILGCTYHVPTWIECRVVSKEKGTSHAREFFWEVYNNSINQVITWSRPARTLANVSFIQALRRMLRITALSDSDVIADINRHYEAELGRKSANKTVDSPLSHSPQTERPLNIDLDSIQVIDLAEEVETPIIKEPTSTQSTPAEDDVTTSAEASGKEQEAPLPMIEVEDNEPKMTVTVKPTALDEQSTVLKVQMEPKQSTVTVEISETAVSREILTIIKPMMQQVKYGLKPLSWLKQYRLAISDEVGLQWFDQEIEKLK